MKPTRPLYVLSHHKWIWGEMSPAPPPPACHLPDLSIRRPAPTCHRMCIGHRVSTPSATPMHCACYASHHARVWGWTRLHNLMCIDGNLCRCAHAQDVVCRAGPQPQLNQPTHSGHRSLLIKPTAFERKPNPNCSRQHQRQAVRPHPPRGAQKQTWVCSILFLTQKLFNAFFGGEITHRRVCS